MNVDDSLKDIYKLYTLNLIITSLKNKALEIDFDKLDELNKYIKVIDGNDKSIDNIIDIITRLKNVDVMVSN